MTRLAPLAACAALAAAPAAAGAEEPTAIFLARLEVESTPGLAPDARLLATLELNLSGAAKAASLREWFPGVRPSEGRVVVVLDGRAPMGIDVASRVAAHREGDCSEHAVLLAAAARLAGRAARVVFGVALVPVEGRLRGFGHAWAEIHDGRAWRTVDATPLPPGVRYLPLAALSDEGPGYLGAVWAALSPIDVRRIRLEPAPAAAR